MNPMKNLSHLKPPCARCPYQLGTVHTVRNPCPECRQNGYRSYDVFVEQAGRRGRPENRK